MVLRERAEAGRPHMGDGDRLAGVRRSPLAAGAARANHRKRERFVNRTGNTRKTTPANRMQCGEWGEIAICIAPDHFWLNIAKSPLANQPASP